MSWRLAAAAVAAAWACSAWAQTPPAQTRPAGTADPGAMVDSLFGPDIRRVQATPDRVDDMHLAKRMLEAARLNHRFELQGGLLEDESRALLQEFFRRRR